MNWIEKFWKDALFDIQESSQNELNRVFWANNREMRIQKKVDNSIVTEIDHFVSDLIKENLIKTVGTKVCFFSEEEKSTLNFPALVVDPIDGTSQLAKGESDCCISIALLETPSLSDPVNRGWIYNPFTGFLCASDQSFVAPKTFNKGPLAGLISKHDYKKGIFNDLKLPLNVQMFPKGSIALKLGFLAAGFCDFVFSRTRKYVWDIAGGSILLEQRGYKTYTRDGILTSLDKEIYNGPILWCRENHYDYLKELLEF